MPLDTVLPRLAPLGLLPGLALGLLPPAQAQTAACDQFIASLGTRMNVANRGLRLEAIPAADPLPEGSRVVGNCSANAYKVVLRSATSPPVEAKVNAPQAAPAPAPAPAAAPAPPPTPSPAPALAPKPPVATAPVAEPGRVAVAETATPAASQAAEDATVPMASTGATARAAGFFARHWPWFAVPLALVLAALLWAWRAHHRAYDAAGLPRGPRLDRG